jgi:hypothetical protein
MPYCMGCGGKWPLGIDGRASRHLDSTSFSKRQREFGRRSQSREGSGRRRELAGECFVAKGDVPPALAQMAKAIVGQTRVSRDTGAWAGHPGCIELVFVGLTGCGCSARSITPNDRRASRLKINPCR